jgi:hypothetical protein
MAAITFFDETTNGTKTEVLTLESLEARVSLRELIRMRVYQEVQDYNRTQAEVFCGLVQPTDTERALNGYKMKTRRKIDWEEQYKKATDSFMANGFLVLVDDHQIESLDEQVDLGIDTHVSFVKLIPLIGG